MIPVDNDTVLDEGNNSGRVITQSVHPSSPRTTTDTSTANPTRDTESTTSGMPTESHIIGTY